LLVKRLHRNRLLASVSGGKRLPLRAKSKAICFFFFPARPKQVLLPPELRPDLLFFMRAQNKYFYPLNCALNII
jgi:hypothetical protein